ncbi:MAG: YceI family protein [Syntrophobacteraceae bacterium]
MDSISGYKLVDSDQLHAMIGSGTDLVIVDTLPEDHFERAHVPGAENACVYQVTFVARMGDLVRDRNRAIVLYGSGGTSRDAITAAGKLVRAGYRNISVLKGGLRAWRDIGFPVDGVNPGGGDETPKILLRDGDYTVDTVGSLVEWAGRNPNSRHHGTVDLSDGFLRVKDAMVTGVFTLDMRRIKNINLEGDPLQPVLLAHLESDDFFFVESFPTAVFTIESARLVDGALLSGQNFSVVGSLTLRGITLPLGFMATLSTPEAGGLSAEAHFDIDRTQWDIIYGSSRFYEHLGMHLVFDLISVQVRIVAHGS